MANPDAMTIRLGLPGIKVLEVIEDEPGRLVLSVQAIAGSLTCPTRRHKTRSVHQVKKTPVRDLAVLGRQTTLIWHKRRFHCDRCKATTTETNASFEEKMTLRLRRHLVAEVVDSTVTAVARRHGLDWHQVMALVASHAGAVLLHRSRQHTKVLLVDEKSLVKGRGAFPRS